MKLISPENFVGFTELGKVAAITKIFEDAYKSPLSLIILDDIERLIDFIHMGPRFSNAVLQTLLVLLKKKPPLSDLGHECKLIILGCTALKDVLETLEVVDCFNINLRVPNVQLDSEVDPILKKYGTTEDQAQAIA